MKALAHRAWTKFLVFFGELKLVKWFPWIQYDPVEYKVDGALFRQISRTVKPGDVLLRRYDGYVDNWFIDGDFSHAGIYAGNDRVIHAVHPQVRADDLVDFCRCDRIAVFRPGMGQTSAVARAESFLGRPYDFDYEEGDSSLYCFEMAALCYAELDVPRFDVSLLLGLIRRKGTYLGKSFQESPDFAEIMDTAKNG